MTIEIQVNGKKQTVALETTLSQLLESLGLTDKPVAIERNLAIVPRSQHPTVQLISGDAIEIVQAIGGG